MNEHKIEKLVDGFRAGLRANADLLPDLDDTDYESLHRNGWAWAYSAVKGLREGEQGREWQSPPRRHTYSL